jgi:hypothetical protein
MPGPMFQTNPTIVPQFHAKGILFHRGIEYGSPELPSYALITRKLARKLNCKGF